MSKMLLRWGIAVGVTALYLGIAVGPALGASLPYEFDQELSLRGDCGTANPDFIPDPGCPGGIVDSVG